MEKSWNVTTGLSSDVDSGQLLCPAVLCCTASAQCEVMNQTQESH